MFFFLHQNIYALIGTTPTVTQSSTIPQSSSKAKQLSHDSIITYLHQNSPEQLHMAVQQQAEVDNLQQASGYRSQLHSHMWVNAEYTINEKSLKLLNADNNTTHQYYLRFKCRSQKSKPMSNAIYPSSRLVWYCWEPTSKHHTNSVIIEWWSINSRIKQILIIKPLLQ